MAGGLTDRYSYKEACRQAGMNMIEEELNDADMVRVSRSRRRRSGRWRKPDKESAGGDLRRRRFEEQ